MDVTMLTKFTWIRLNLFLVDVLHKSATPRQSNISLLTLLSCSSSSSVSATCAKHKLFVKLHIRSEFSYLGYWSAMLQHSRKGLLQFGIIEAYWFHALMTSPPNLFFLTQIPKWLLFQLSQSWYHNLAWPQVNFSVARINLGLPSP